MKVFVQCGHFNEDGSHDEREIMSFYARYLNNTGVEVTVGDSDVPATPESLAGCDIAHFFGTSAQIAQSSTSAKIAGIPSVATPVYWNDEYPIYYRVTASGPDDDLPPTHEPPLTSAYYRKMMSLSKVKQQKTVLENAVLVFGSGVCEKKLLCRDFDLPQKKVVVLPLGVEISMGLGDPKLIRDKLGVEEFVLCVGEVRERKNQHALLEVCRERELPVVFVGPVGDDADDYSNYCRALAHDQTVFAGELEPRLLKSAYQAASAVVQPGLSELPGLPVLSAALAGSPVVVTERGTAFDYLGREAFYCDPEDHFSIADALDAALSTGRNQNLKKVLLDKYSWTKTVIMMINIYKKILKIG